MSEAALEEEVRQAKDAVTEADAAYAKADGESKSQLFQMYMVKAKALEQLREQVLMQQRAVAGIKRNLIYRTLYMMCMENLSQCNCCVYSQSSSVKSAQPVLCGSDSTYCYVFSCSRVFPAAPSMQRLSQGRLCRCRQLHRLLASLTVKPNTADCLLSQVVTMPSGHHLSTRFTGNTSNAIQGSMVGTATTNTDRLRKHEQVVQLLHMQWQCNVYSVCLPK